MPNADLIELIQEQWARERPDLASGGFGVVGRLLLLGKLLERRGSDDRKHAHPRLNALTP